MRRSPSIPSCVGMKLMKVVMRSCMHIQDDHHDEINGSGGRNDDDDRQIKKSRSRSRNRSRSSKSSKSSSSSSSSSSSIIRVVNWEGGVKTYWRPTKVGEVITESPKQSMVCSSDSLYIGQKIPPLSDQHLLQPGHTYFLLPSHLFNSALSFATVASILSTSGPRAGSQINNTLIKKKNLASCQPFLIQKSPSGCSRIRVSGEFIISHIVDDDDDDEEKDDKYGSCLCTTPRLQKEYAQLVQSRRPHWKPNLPTITETTKPTTARRRRRRRKNKLNNLTSSNSLPLPPPTSISKSNNTKAHRKMKLFKSTTSSSSSRYCPKSS